MSLYCVVTINTDGEELRDNSVKDELLSGSPLSRDCDAHHVVLNRHFNYSTKIIKCQEECNTECAMHVLKRKA